MTPKHLRLDEKGKPIKGTEILKRYSQKDGMLVENPNGSWVRFSDIEGTEQEIKDWMRKYAKHADYPKCEIRKTGECTCGLNYFLKHDNK